MATDVSDDAESKEVNGDANVGRVLGRTVGRIRLDLSADRATPINSLHNSFSCCGISCCSNT